MLLSVTRFDFDLCISFKLKYNFFKLIRKLAKSLCKFNESAYFTMAFSMRNRNNFQGGDINNNTEICKKCEQGKCITVITKKK